MSATPAKSRIVALLPMKANSERVKGKNFRELLRQAAVPLDAGHPAVDRRHR
jgi:hypothetical protein